MNIENNPDDNTTTITFGTVGSIVISLLIGVGVASTLHVISKLF